MYWQEDTQEKTFEVDGEVVDVLFKLECKSLPVDHNQLLFNGLEQLLPWLKEEPRSAIHSIHVAESINGWERPAREENSLLHLSRRTRMTIRVPVGRLKDVETIVDKAVYVGEHVLQIKQLAITKKLLPISTIFCRYVVSESENESEFMDVCAGEIQAMGVNIKKMLCGKSRYIELDNGPVLTRTLMLADLSKDESIKLQQHGIGKYQHLGCGIFIPHKGIEAVNKGEEEKN